MALKDRLNEIQKKLDIISVWEVVANMPMLPPDIFPEKHTCTNEALDQVTKELCDYARQKIAEVEDEAGVLKTPAVKVITEEDINPKSEFTPAEVGVLKVLATGLMKKANIPTPVGKVSPERNIDGNKMTVGKVVFAQPDAEEVAFSNQTKVLATVAIKPHVMSQVVNVGDAGIVEGTGKDENELKIKHVKSGRIFFIPRNHVEAI